MRDFFQRAKDALVFPSEFARWENFAQVNSMLEGNRVAEMFGQSPSYGLSLDVGLMRRIHRDLRTSVLERTKAQGVSSQQGVIQLICEMGDAYLKASGQSVPPERLLFCLSLLAPRYSPLRNALPPRWEAWLAADEEASRIAFEEARAFLPVLLEARKDAAALVASIVASIEIQNVSPETISIWKLIPSEEFETERTIASRSDQSLATVVACIHAFKHLEIVTIIGTALDEPRFRKTPYSVISEDKASFRVYLDNCR